MILRFEDAVAKKCRMMFYLKKGSKVSILKAKHHGFILSVDLTHGIKVDSIDNLIKLTCNAV